ncbi:Protein NASP homolog [Sergentomyia squamirostris]
MASSSREQSQEEIEKAKELFSSGTRNYYVKDYDHAVEDLSQVCTLYSDVYGSTADELGAPYFLYAKALIGLAQNEVKLIDIPEGEESEDSQSESCGEEVKEEEEPEEEATPSIEEKLPEAEKKEKEFEDDDDDDEVEEEGSKPVKEEDEITNLQLAWEILELAVTIFTNRGESGKSQLAECRVELAGISFENNTYEEAVRDYVKARDILVTLPDTNQRHMAELYYKLGLCQMMVNSYSDSIASLNSACDCLDKVIAENKEKGTTEDEITELIAELEDTKKDISCKIEEIRASKMAVLEDLTKKCTQPAEKSDKSPAASSEASSTVTVKRSATAQEPTNINHLIKRKKTE